MGTNTDNSLQREKPSALSGNLSGLSAALAQAAQALFAVASALQGEGSSAPRCRPLSFSPDLTLTVGETVNEFLRAKAKAGRSDRYLRALRVSLCSFAKGRYTAPLAGVGVTELEDWLHAGQWANRTQRGYLADVRTMFNFAVRRGFVEKNPAAAVELPPLEQKAPCVHSPEQVAAALDFARGYDLNLCRALALRYFAGLRSIEVERSAEANIHAGHFEVTAANAKQVRGRRRRIVTLQPALAAWLALGGTIDFGNGGNRWRLFNAAFTAATKIPFPDNVTRHSFVSYHLAEFGNAGRTALEAGHSEAMLFAHYREIVTKEQSAAFWAIRPKPTR